MLKELGAIKQSAVRGAVRSAPLRVIDAPRASSGPSGKGFTAEKSFSTKDSATHTFGSKNKFDPSILSKPFSADTHPGSIDIRGFKTIAKAPDVPALNSQPLAEKPGLPAFNTEGFKTEWKRQPDIAVNFLKPNQPAGEGKPTGVQGNTENTTSTQPPRQAEKQSTITGTTKKEQVSEIKPQQIKKEEPAGGLEINDGSHTNDKTNSHLRSPDGIRTQDWKPYSLPDGDRSPHADRFVVERIQAKDYKTLAKTAENSETSAKIGQSEVADLKRAYTEKFGNQISDATKQTEQSLNSTRGNGSKTTVDHRQNRIENERLQGDVPDSADMELAGAAKIEQMLEKLKASAPPGSEYENINPREIALRTAKASIENKRINPGTITHDESEPESVESRDELQQVLPVEQAQEQTIEQENLPESALEMLRENEQTRVMRQLEIASLKEEIAIREQELQQEGHERYRGIVAVVDNKANSARRERLREAGRIVFQANTSSGQPVASAQQILPLIYQPQEDEISGIVKHEGLQDGSRDSLLVDFIREGEFTSVQEVDAAADRIIKNNNAVTVEESEGFSSELATKEEILKVLRFRLAMLEQAA